MDPTTPPMPGSFVGVPEPDGHNPNRDAYLLAAVGLAHALLFLLACLLTFTVPDAYASNAAIRDYYTAANERRLAISGLFLMPFAGITFIWFTVRLRQWIRGHAPRVDVLLTDMQLISGVLYVAMFFVSAAATSMVATEVEFANSPITPAFAREYPLFGSALLFVFGIRMAAMFVFTTTNIGTSAGVLPRWFRFLGLGVGLFLLVSVSFNRALVLVFPVWIVILCILIVLRARQTAAVVVVPSRDARSAPSGGDRVDPGR